MLTRRTVDEPQRSALWLYAGAPQWRHRDEAAAELELAPLAP